jgi:hypothetical protein
VRRLSLGLTVVAALLAGGSQTASAQPRLAGTYDLVGVDGIGPYRGRVQVIDKGPWYECIREATYQNPVSGKPLTVVWIGHGVERAGGAELHVTYPRNRAGWVAAVGTLRRTAADRLPDVVTGAYRPDPSGGLAGVMSSPGGVVVNEALTYTGPSGATPIHVEDRTELTVHGPPPTWLKTILFALFRDYHQLPFNAPYRTRQQFQDAVHYELRDRIGFDWLRAHPGERLLMNKVVDDISIEEAEVRANAYGLRLFEKAAGYDGDASGRHLYEGLLSSGVRDNPAVPGGLEKNEDMSTCLWSGMYLYSQSLRYQVTNDPQALVNVERLADRMCDLVEIDPRQGEFARSIRPIGARPLGGSWRAGTGRFAHLAYHVNGNNDMVKGFWVGFLGAWDVLPQSSPVRARMLTCVREIADSWASSNPSAAGGTGHKRDRPGNNLLNNMLAFWMTGDSKYETAYKKALRKPILLAELAAGGTFAAYGIADWSGTNLGVVSAVARIELARRLGSGWERLFKHTLKMSYRFVHPYRLTLWSVAAAGYLARPGAADEVLWQLREFPYPKAKHEVSREFDATFSFSPYPELMWKADWMQGNRKQSLHTYPVFMRGANNFVYRSNPFADGRGATVWEYAGPDYLFGYWLARRLGVVSATE